MSNSKDILSTVIASTPVNATAGRVMSKGVHYEPAVRLNERKHSSTPVHSDCPIPTIPIPEAAWLHGTFVDLTGLKFGRMTVIGYAGKLNPKKSASWVVRCACGNYETRKAHAIKSGGGGPGGTRCAKCEDWEHKKYVYETFGSKGIDSFIPPKE